MILDAEPDWRVSSLGLSKSPILIFGISILFYVFLSTEFLLSDCFYSISLRLGGGFGLFFVSLHRGICLSAVFLLNDLKQ
jgi:hypothetical protein